MQDYCLKQKAICQRLLRNIKVYRNKYTHLPVNAFYKNERYIVIKLCFECTLVWMASETGKLTTFGSFNCNALFSWKCLFIPSFNGIN